MSLTKIIKRKVYEKFLKWKISRLYQENIVIIGGSCAKIASNLGIPRSAVQNLISYELKKSTWKSGPKAIIDKRKSLMLKIFISDSNYKGVKVTTTSI